MRSLSFPGFIASTRPARSYPSARWRPRNGRGPTEPEPIRTISREELRAELDRGEPIKLIRALGRWAFDAKHIPGSLHFDDPEELYRAVDPDDDVIVYCSTVDCLSSVALYRDLVGRGYRNVRRYAGGLIDWEDAGLPLEGALVESEPGTNPNTYDVGEAR